MPNIGSAIKEEIIRLSRKETRSQVEPAKKATAQHRREIAELKRQMALLKRQVALLSRKVLGMPEVASEESAAKNMRFSAKGLRVQRERLGLSAADFGQLVGVSAQSVYLWEQEKTRPRAEQLVKISAVRKMGKREASARLEQVAAKG